MKSRSDIWLGLLTHQPLQYAMLNYYNHCNSDRSLRLPTLFYGLLDDRQRSVSWASGGHDPAIWYHGGTGIVEELPNTGPPLGLMEDIVFKQAGPIQLKQGDILVIGTDGIWETIDTAHEEPFGKNRLKSLIRTHSDQTAALLCSTICASVVDCVHPGSLKDDVTLVAIKAH